MKGFKFRALFLLFIFHLTVLFSASAHGSDFGFNLRLYGGLNYLSGGEFNTGLKGLNDYQGEHFWFFGLTHAGGEYNPVHRGLDIGGDLIFQITPALGVGIGAGYVQANNDSAISYGPVSAGMTTAAELSAIPLRLSVFYTLLTGSAIRINLHAGLSYYLAAMSFDFRPYSPGSWTQYSADADGGGLGFHGGLGVELKLSQTVAIFLEGQGRYARLGGFEGTGTISNSSGGSVSANGTVYSFTMNQGLLGYFPGIFVFSTAPSGTFYSDVRETKIDFSGLSAVAGIIFRFKL